METNADAADFDRQVRLRIYEHFLAHSAPPATADVAHALGAPEGNVVAAYDRLAAGRVIVLGPGTRTIMMAAPLSAVPTRFRVTVPGGRAYWANCIWDALGVPAMLGTDARIEARCGDCDAALVLDARGDTLAGAGVVHFAVPAAQWWEDIVFT